MIIMVSITFGILLAIPLKDADAKHGKSKKSKRNRSKSSKKSKSSKRSKKSKSKRSKSSKKSKEKREIPKVIKPPYVFEVGAPKGYFHIEYNLLPNESPTSVDIVFWDTISKIFTPTGTVIYKNHVQNERIWIPLTLQHFYKELSEEELLKVKQHVINCTFSPNKKKVGQSAKSEKGKVFYIREIDLDSKGIVQAFAEDPNVMNDEQSISSEPETENIKILYNDEVVMTKMFRIIESVSMNREVYFKEYVPNSPEPLEEYEELEEKIETFLRPKSGKKGKKGKKDKKGKKGKPAKQKKAKKKKKKSKKGKSKKIEDSKIPMSGESYFTDPVLCIYGLKEGSVKLEKAFTIMRVENLLTVDEKINMNPFIIKIKCLNNLPIDNLIKAGISSVYLRYSIPFIARATTLEKPLSKNIKINESHAFLYVPSNRLIEFLETRRLRIELIGLRNNEITPRVYNPNYKDNIKNFTEVKATKILLAVACYDLSQLYTNTSNFIYANSLRHPNNLLSQEISTLYALHVYHFLPTTNRINFDTLYDTKYESPLTDANLIDHGTYLKIETNLTAPLEGLHQMLAKPELFRRLLLVVYNEEVAIVILNEILLHNQDFICEVIVENYLNLLEEEHDNVSKIVTGFLIDNGNCFIFFLEGTLANYCQEMIRSQVMDFNQSVCNVLFNSEHAYTDRIYKNFLSIGGFYTIALEVPLQEMLKIKHIFIEGNVPTPSYKALMKLSQLLKAQTMKEINQYCLLPTASELMSFNIEFGVPMKMKVR